MKQPAKKAWSELGWQIVGAVIGAAVLLGVGSWAAWLTIDEINQGKKLQGVEKVGPCRAAGITNEECQEQAALIFAACYIQRKKCREKYGMELVRVSKRDRRGGDALQPGSTGSQPTGPRGGGDGSAASAPPSTGSDPTPAPPSSDPGSNSNSKPSPSNSKTGSSPPEGPEPPARGPVEGVTSTAAGVVEQVGEGAGKAVEGAGETAGCVLRGSC